MNSNTQQQESDPAAWAADPVAYGEQLSHDGSLETIQVLLVAEGLSKHAIPHGNEKSSTSAPITIPRNRAEAISMLSQAKRVASRRSRVQSGLRATQQPARHITLGAERASFPCGFVRHNVILAWAAGEHHEMGADCLGGAWMMQATGGGVVLLAETMALFALPVVRLAKLSNWECSMPGGPVTYRACCLATSSHRLLARSPQVRPFLYQKAPTDCCLAALAYRRVVFCGLTRALVCCLAERTCGMDGDARRRPTGPPVSAPSSDLVQDPNAERWSYATHANQHQPAPTNTFLPTVRGMGYKIARTRLRRSRSPYHTTQCHNRSNIGKQPTTPL
ncbi:hypothetical protein PG985_004830 [Apiospora marii]|uniref:uncharacterized protein n=1 Tax=Apiospora marii TaxID=335849 RepID=UPI00312E34EC